MKLSKKLAKHKHIAVAIAGGVLAVALGLGVVFLGNRSDKKDPATILPAWETKLLARNVTADSLRLLQDRIQGLDGISLPGHAVDIALLDTGTNLSWVMFDATTAPAGMRFSITASDTAAQSLIKQGDGRLSDDREYKGIMDALPDGTVAFVRLDELTMKDPSIFDPFDTTGIVFEPSRTRILLPQAHFSSAIPELFSDQAAALLQSYARTTISALFGPQISPAYDVLALFHEPLSLRVMQNGSVTVMGKARDGRTTDTMVAKLHDAFASKEAGSEVVTKKLDDQFSYTGIRQADASVNRTKENRNGYAVEKSVRSGGNGTFITAIGGSSVILTTDEAALADAIDGFDANGNTFSIRLDGPSVASAMPLLKGTARPIDWSVSRDRYRAFLEIPR